VIHKCIYEYSVNTRDNYYTILDTIHYKKKKKKKKVSLGVLGYLQVPVGSGSGVVISTSLLLGLLGAVGLTVVLMAAQRHYHHALVEKIDEFIEQVSSIDMSQSIEMGSEAMEMQMQAAKQAQLLEFVKSFIQPKIVATEITRDEAGKFS